MSLPWFRVYSDMVDNEKLRLLAFEDRWHFVAILCCMQQGIIKSDDALLERKISVKLGLQLRELDEVKRRLIEVNLIDDAWRPVGWDEHQFVSDSSSERVRKFREKHKEMQCNVSETLQETLQERFSNVIDTDTNTYTNTYTNTETQKTKKKAKTALPKNFSISESVRSWYSKQGYKENIDQHLIAFIDKAIANGYQYVDWDAAFRNAIRDDWAGLRKVKSQMTSFQGKQKDGSDDYWKGYRVV